MSVVTLLRTPCTLLARTQDGPADEYGNPSWQAAEQATVCELQQAGSSEEAGDALQVARWRLFLARRRARARLGCDPAGGRDGAPARG